MSYIPSITAWSRQAIFKGSNPDLNENNSKEKQLFHQFWGDCGLSSYQIKYQKFGVGNELNPDTIPEDVKVLGLVCNDLDEMMHGTIMGDIQLLSSTIQWADKCNISGIVGALREKRIQSFSNNRSWEYRSNRDW
ncbi:MAG: PglZ domain-containing protein [Ignavibacteriales bacterium]|nr:PglZ domain-containing protein [Ignavibacteriales bacterium]